MKVTWQIEDGYAGGRRPHTVEIPDEEYNECVTDYDRDLLIEEYVQEAFEQKVTWRIVRIDI